MLILAFFKVAALNEADNPVFIIDQEAQNNIQAQNEQQENKVIMRALATQLCFGLFDFGFLCFGFLPLSSDTMIYIYMTWARTWLPLITMTLNFKLMKPMLKEIFFLNLFQNQD